jgi:hypothetical protein
MTSALPGEFQPFALVERIVLGATQADQVRLHGAIVAALEIHGGYTARNIIFAARRWTKPPATARPRATNASRRL